MASKVSSGTPEPSASTLVYSGVDCMLHVGSGTYVHVTSGSPVPDGVDPSTLGPDWVPSTVTKTEEV
jgi:hypothetical protein